MKSRVFFRYMIYITQSLKNLFVLKFTWEGPLGKFSRIDRVLINSKWALLWPDAILQTDQSDRSDHKPIIWAKKLLFSGDLKTWNSQNQDADFVNLKSIVAEIKRLKFCFQSRDLSLLETSKLAALKASKKQISITIESKRRLQSRFLWLKLGDKNSRFFHLASRIRQQSSYVAGMQINGLWVDDPILVKEHAVSFFENLFSAIPSRSDIIDVDWGSLGLACVPAPVGSMIEAQFTASEVASVIRGFEGNKTPGPDGFSLHFF
ncbi:uncharacterized protein [Rutidosis leptorrhynchoides]|uniref:uncharacterized protein n=1 Tax=Rutidosis leptorrhynchoides TaxID=125765 RepID=UPI003A994AC1